MKLYGAPISPYVRKILAYAAIKGLELELIAVGMGDPNPEFASCSPFRKMPGFSDGDFKISDSTAIITYLESKYPKNTLTGISAEDRARIMWFDEFADTIFAPVGAGIFFNRVVAPRFLGQEGDLVAAELAEKEGLPPILDYIESVIPQSGYLVGDALSLADISVASVFVNMSHLGIVPDPSSHPKTAAWLAIIHATPGFAKWIPREKKLLEQD